MQTNNAQIIPQLQVWRSDRGNGNAYTRVTSVLLTPTPPANPNINGGYIRKLLFSGTLNPPINVRQGDVLGLVLSNDGQLVIQTASFPDVSLPMNYIFTSASNFSDMDNVDLQMTGWTSIEFQQPLISLDMGKYKHMYIIIHAAISAV